MQKEQDVVERACGRTTNTGLPPSLRPACRTGEIGIRQAVGATRWQVARPILRAAIVLTPLGTAIGLRRSGQELHFDIIESPSAAWTAQPLVEAFARRICVQSRSPHDYREQNG